MYQRTQRVLVAVLATAVVSFQIIPTLAFAASGYLTLSSFSGQPGSTITTSGGGFASGDVFNVYVSNTSGTPAATTTIKADGSFSAPITVPANAPQGALSIIGVDTKTNVQATNSYYVNPLTPTMTFTALSHSPFASVSVSGSGFAPNEIVLLGLAGASSSPKANATGAFTGNIIVPIVASGLYHLTATGAASGATIPNYLNYFWIDGFYPSASPSTYYLLPGATLTFSGSGFAANETISVFQGNSASPTTTFVAGADGSFKNAGGVVIPLSAANSTISYTLRGQLSNSPVTVSTGVGAFYPSLSPASYYVLPNSKLIVNGSGFAPSETVTFSVVGSTTTTATSTDAKGNVAGTITVPFSKTGSATINAVGSVSKAATSVTVTLASFYPSVSPSAWYLYPGDLISYHVSGFAPNESVSATIGTAGSTFTTDNTGSFTTASTSVPFNTNGSLKATFVGSLSNATVVNTIGVGAVSPLLTSDLYSAQQGQTVHVTGTHFAAGETVHVTAGSFATSTTANASGTTPAVAIPTPFNTSSVSITFTGVSSNASASLTIGLQTLMAQLTPSTYFTTAGTPITVTAVGFAPNESIHVTAGSFSTTTKANATGAVAAVSITTPYNATSLQITFTGASSNVTASATVGLGALTPQVTPSTYFTTAGTPISFVGKGFAASETVAVTFNGSTIAPVSASATGTFNYSYTPSFSAQSANFNFTGNLSNKPQAISIGLSAYNAGIQLSTYYAQGGSPLTITGAGFAPNESIALKANNVGFATTTANTSGGFSFVGTVPFGPAGNMPINAIGQSSNASASATITLATIYNSLQLAAYAGAPGTAITFIGSGYLPNEPIQIMTDRTTGVAYTFNAGAGGSFTNSGYIVPVNWTGGPLVLTVKGTHSFTSTNITYYVTGK